MSRNYMSLFNGRTRVSGGIERLPARQNEKEGRLHIWLYNMYGDLFFEFKGHEMTLEQKAVIRQTEQDYDVSSGIDLALMLGI